MKKNHITFLVKWIKRFFGSPRVILFNILWCLLITSLEAQQVCGEETIHKALQHYEEGRFESSIELLVPCLEQKGLDRRSLKAIHRIVANSYLAMDHYKDAEKVILQLLEMVPDFEPGFEDDPELTTMVTQLKNNLSSNRVTSVSKSSEKLSKAPATVMVITSEDIRNRGYIDLEALFNDLPGFDVSRTYGATYSNIYQRGYRSNNTDRTLFLLDDMEENDFWGSFPYWARQYPTNNVERVEIVYGPASTMYGANAFLGVVNVITKDPFEGLTDESPTSLFTEVGSGSNRTRFVEAGLNTKRKSIFLSATVRGYFSDEHDLSGYPDYNYAADDYTPDQYQGLNLNDLEEVADFVRKNGAEDQKFYTVSTHQDSITLTRAGAEAASRLDSAFIANQNLEYNNLLEHLYLNVKLKTGDFLMGYQNWKSWHGSTNYGTDNARPPANRDKNISVWQPRQSILYINYEKDLNDDISISNVAQYRITKVNDKSNIISLRNYRNGSLNLSSLIEQVNPYWDIAFFYQKSAQFRNEFRFNYSASKALQIVGGLEVKNSTIQGDYNRIPADTSDLKTFKKSKSNREDSINYFVQRNLGTYVQLTNNFGDIVRLTLGGRLDYNQVRDQLAYAPVFNPRIALVITPMKEEAFVLKGIYATAYQVASVRDKYSTAPTRLLPNPDLQPERVKNFEFGVSYQKAGIQIDATGYHSVYSNVIGQVQVGSTGQNQNIGEREVFGLQSAFSYQLGSSHLLHCDLYANYNYTQPWDYKLDRAKKRINSSKTKVGDISSHRFNLGINALFSQKINLNLRMNYVGARKVGEGTTVPHNPQENDQFDAYMVLNGAITYRKLLPGLDVQLVVNNLLDKEYFHPGIRSADGITQAFRTPQKGINYLITLTYNTGFVKSKNQ
ncbi:TonB-dependent siderophore receptor [Fulvivirga sp. M361]|uniref:TonB-dependent receptor plug domain-containing protein n=1 Tax=Fulvivirga sp. M361 TaxID=2594266 RepID=UPI001629F48E|nr:TonB-dependent receptor [Fulvivirga sp. M361]